MSTKDIELTSVKKLESGVYLINEMIKVSNLSIESNGQFLADVDYNEEVYSERDVEILIGRFVGEALADRMENEAIMPQE